MKQIVTHDADRLIFRDDWGIFWRVVGWLILGFAGLFILGSFAPPPATASTRPAATQPAKPQSPVFLAIMMLALAGWGLYRRWIILDRRRRTIQIRCGVGLFSWVRQRQFDEFQCIVVRRRESSNDQQVYYRVVAQGKQRSLTIGTINKDQLFDSSGQAEGFALVVSKFCNLKYEPHGQ